MSRLLTGVFLIFTLAFQAHSQSVGTKNKSKKGYAASEKLVPVDIVNFNKKGQQITRFDIAGDAVDAHDGEIAYFDGTYYLYGTSYDCGFAWQNKTAPFCGFKTYSSPDLVNWTDRGYLFDATNAVWQSRCNGNTYGCFRPHVIYNKKTENYVLWVNVYDNRVGFRVFTSKSPVGPFTEVENPKLAVNNDADVAGLNNGDHDTFVDDDGTGYVAYTDWRTKGAIVVEELTPDYLSGTGRHVKAVTPGKTEAPGILKRNGIYYLLYSDPNCGYCPGTGTSYRTAKSPLGPWSEGIKISDKSCGGQPSFVSTIQFDSETVYLYGSDLWNNAAKNEALANYFWAPLTFDSTGAIKPIPCNASENVRIRKGKPGEPVITKDLNVSSGLNGFTTKCDISKGVTHTQTFVATRSGILSAINVTTFRNGYPDAGLEVALYPSDASGKASGTALYSTVVAADSMGWAAKKIYIHPEKAVTKGKKYVLSVISESTKGCYGLEINEANQSLKFETYIQKQ